MGKPEDEQALSTVPSSSSEAAEGNAGDGCPRCRSIGKIVRPRCVVALVLGVAVLLSAVFWLPPFLRRSGDLRDRSRDPWFKGEDLGVLGVVGGFPEVSAAALGCIAGSRHGFLFLGQFDLILGVICFMDSFYGELVGLR